MKGLGGNQYNAVCHVMEVTPEVVQLSICHSNPPVIFALLPEDHGGLLLFQILLTTIFSFVSTTLLPSSMPDECNSLSCQPF